MISAKDVKELREVTGAGMMDCKKALVETDGNIDEAVKWLREKGVLKAAKKENRVAAEGICAFYVNGNEAIIYEVNSETDFVAKNEKFQAVVLKLGKILLANKINDDEKALEASLDNEVVKDILIDATATIGEKISLRRVNYLSKSDTQVFGEYSHMGGKIAVVTMLEGGNEEVAKNVCMHIAAMNPKYLDKADVDTEFLNQETEVLKQETINEGKPANLVDKIAAGKVQKLLSSICLVDQLYVKNQDQTVKQYLSSNSSAILKFIRLEVGEGIEKKKDDFAAEVMATAQN